MELQMHKTAGSQSITLSDAAFGYEFNESLVHQVVTAFLAGGRAGTKAQKTKAMVRGGGKTFAAVPRDHSQKVNRKMYTGALRAIVSELVRQDRVVVLPEFGVSAPKTKELAGKLKDLGLNNVLIVTENVDEKLYLASRNLPGVEVRDATGLDPVSLIGFEKVLFTVPSIRRVEEWLA